MKAGITIGCSAAMVVAAALAYRWRRTRWAPSPLSGAEPWRERLAVSVGRTGGMVVGALLAGVLTLGAGARLMMRVVAATSPDEVQGRLTEADEVIGRASGGGSLFLILGLGGASGVLGLAFYSVLRRWLPDRSAAAGLLGVAVGAGLLARPSGLIDPDNVDFTLVEPVLLAVVLSLVTLALFGAAFGVLVDHLADRWPRPGWSPQGVASVVPFALLLPAPPVLALAALGVLGGTALPSLRARTGRARSPSGGVGDAGPRAGRIVLVALGALGCASVLVAAVEVMR